MRPDIKKAAAAFYQQRYNAGRRGIGWHLTFDEWWSIWRDSGHWPERGRGSAAYCMCRVGDKGPYALGNVFIATFSENSSTIVRKTHLPIGVRASKSGKYFATKRQNYLGMFATPEQAREAYLNF